MKEKETITKDNYKEKTLKRAIIVCWILLAICFVVKICGGNFFNIVCNNENFIKFCNYCDTSFIRYVFYYPVFIIESSLLLITIKPDKKIFSINFVLYIICCSLFWIVKVLHEIQIIKLDVNIANIFPIIILYLLLMIFSKKPLTSLICLIYQTALTLLSSFIRNISFVNLMTDSFLITTIFLIDYYIAMILTVLYRKRIYLKREIK